MTVEMVVRDFSIVDKKPGGEFLMKFVYCCCDVNGEIG